MMRKLLLVGGGGHCRSIIESLRGDKTFHEISVVDRPCNVGKQILGAKIIGTDEDLIRLRSLGYTDAFVSVGSIGDTALRRKLIKAIQNTGFHIPNIIDPNSHVSPSAELGQGIYIGKSAIINAECVLGDGVIINTAALVEHECIIGAFVHVAPGAVLCGNVSIGADTHIGANATVLQGIRIGGNVLIGAGSVITQNISCNKRVAGVPGHELIREE